MVSPKQKKRVVKAAAEKGLCSLRRACAYLSLSWSTFSYRPKQASEKAQRLVERIVALSWKHPRYGYRRIRALLVKEGWTTSRKFVQAVRRSEGLQVKPPKKRRHRQGVSTGAPTKAKGRNHVWSWDFVHDRTDNGGPLKMMTLIDEYTRKCLDIRVARQLTSTDVLSVLSEAIEEEGAPSYIRSDNGSEFIALQVQQWLSGNNIKAIYIDPGSPWLPSEATPQRVKARITNGYIESFHNRLRDECLNREVLLSVAEAQIVIKQWRYSYNNEHPHSRLGFKSPQEFVRFLSDLGCVRATPSLRQDLSYTSILKPLTAGNSLT